MVENNGLGSKKGLFLLQVMKSETGLQMEGQKFEVFKKIK